jgi:acetyl/propionyl-CoA carboxylase alpha subunit/acetyl-CoA carboxylase carboxyltransferase component
MVMHRLLIANRGEIAIRIARAAAELGVATVAVYSEDDARSLHVRKADMAAALSGVGPQAYLDAAQLVAAARAAGCDAVHPGYGFLSESAAFARACLAAGLTFVGPRAETLELCGDKPKARALARRLGIPVLEGTYAATSLDEARTFMHAVGGAIVIKASAGGGGRGMRVVTQESELADSYARCQSEAEAAFGRKDVYVERCFPHARHIEVQILGDGRTVVHLWERECTLQRRHQKLVELAPSPSLSDGLRTLLLNAALRMAQEARYENAGTFEFLVDAGQKDDVRYAFIEANARLQVEHTVTEAVLGVDIVQAQLRLAAGATLEELQLTQEQIGRPRGQALQVRVNTESMTPDGMARPAGGVLRAFEPPSGPGVRVDACGYAGYQASARFDSLLAKVIAHAPNGGLAEAAQRAYRALSEFRIEGVTTNVCFLQNLLRSPDVLNDEIDTRYVETHMHELARAAEHPKLYADPALGQATLAGVQVDAGDPLAVLKHGKRAAGANRGGATVKSGVDALYAPLQGTIVSVDVGAGDVMRKGQQAVVMESMKMEHVVAAPDGGRVLTVAVRVGDAVLEGALLIEFEATEAEEDAGAAAQDVDLDGIRADLRETLDRQARMRDEARPAAVARRRATQQRTARENVADLCDPGTFVEYGALTLAAQAARRPLDELIEKSPADGLITGVGAVNRAQFGDPASRCVVLAYDYTVFAGTQGARNHAKTDRMLRIAREARMPVILFAEGGGGRPGDTETSGDSGGTPTFGRFAELSGLAPLIGIASGRCFAGNASLLGCCDVVIATRNANIGMGGPAMVEGGGLGVFAPEEIGPFDMQLANGVIDLGVRDEAEAVRVAKQYLSYFQGRAPSFEAPDQRLLRQLIPENRLRVYDIHKLIATLADADSVLELRREFARGMVTALIRVEGRPLGVIANNPKFLGGAIDAPGADKAARFMQVCDAFDVPLLFLCDTPGIMVGPEIEKSALVRHSSRMFVIGASLTVPFFTIVLRKAYGLGALAMAGGSFKRAMSTAAWPTGEFGGMGLEGAVKLAFRNELARIDDADERKRKYEELVAQQYERGKALSIATIFGVDDVIDPAESRRWLTNLLSAAPAPERRAGKKRPAIDAW